MSARRLRRLLSLAAVVLLPALFTLLAAAAPPSDFVPLPAYDVFTPSGSLQGLNIQLAARTGGNDQIVAITHAGDDRLFLTIRDGRIKIFADGEVRSQVFLDIRSLTTTDSERGLLSTAFHPRYSENGFFFVNYTNRAGDTVIARYRVSANDPNRADPASARILLTIQQPFSNHNGGQLQFGPDGFLYVGMGDGGAAGDPACRAQRDDELLGKMLRLDVDQNVNSAPFYGIPADNPFRGADGVRDEIWASGLRNPWRFSFDRQTGDLWLSDVGQNAREEVNLQPANSNGGENYGWKPMEGSLCFGNDACPAGTPPCNSAALTLPVLEYGRDLGCSIIGGYIYRGSGVPSLRGTYIFGDLCTGRIWGATRQGTGFQVREAAIPAGTNLDGLVTFGEDSRGELYLASAGDHLYRLTGSGANPEEPGDGIGLYQPAAARFHLRGAGPQDTAVRIVRFGRPGSGWIPLAGDWNADGTDTIGLFDPREAVFRLENNFNGGAADLMFRLGNRRSNWVPLAGDWDGDGTDGVGFWDPATSTFRLRNDLSAGAFDITFVFGNPGGGQRPVIGDWDGDGDDTVALYTPESGLLRLRNSLTAGAPDGQVTGPAIRGGQPVGGDWNGDGRDTLGVYDARAGVFRLLEAPGDGVIRLGPRRSNWIPVAGSW